MTATQPHDSLTCKLDAGRACQMCYWANTRHGLVECPGCWQWIATGTKHTCGEPAEPSLLAQEEAQLVIGAIPLRALPDEPRDYDDKQIASLATIRAALFDVLDTGCNCDSGEKHPWELDEDPNDKDVTEEIVDLQRQRFVDAVIARIDQLQRPPHNFDATSNNYQSGYADGWAAAHTATLREQNADLREMLRLAQMGRER